VPPDLLKLAVEVGALPSPAMPEPKPLVPFTVGAPDASWGERLKRREAPAEYKQYSRGGKSFLLDKDIPMLETLEEGEAGLEAMRKAIREGMDKNWTHPQVAIPRDIDLLKRFPGFQKSVLPAVRLPGEPRGSDTWRRGRLHAHEYGPVWLVHEDAHAPQSKRVTDLKGALKFREMLNIEAARHAPEAGRAQLRRYRALRPVVLNTPKGRWEREKTSGVVKLAQNPPPMQAPVDPTGNMWGLAGGAGTLLAGGLAGRAALPQVAGSRVAQHLLTDAQVATAKQWAARRGALGGALLAAYPAWRVAQMVANSPRRHTAWQHQVFGF